MSKKSVILNTLIAVSAIGCVGFALYPTIANNINQASQDKTIETYNTVVQSVNTTALDEMWDDAKAYNKNIASIGRLFATSDTLTQEYNETLNPDGDGLMGYVDIPDQNIHLAIYHGTDEETLETAVGHMEGTSFPTDGENVFSIITGHTGLPNLDLFTDIHDMEEGDTFTITALNRTLTYTVDDISVVLPEEMYNLSVIKGENYCTLVTCTPYGINDHRLLVRGKLTNVEETGTTKEVISGSSFTQRGTGMNEIIKYGGYLIIAIIVGGAAVVIIKTIKDRR